MKTFEEFNNKKKLNEEFVELPSFENVLDDLYNEYREWYQGTIDVGKEAFEDTDYKNITEMAIACKKELLETICDEFNKIDRNKKAKVNIDFK